MDFRLFSYHIRNAVDGCVRIRLDFSSKDKVSVYADSPVMLLSIKAELLKKANEEKKQLNVQESIKISSFASVLDFWIHATRQLPTVPVDAEFKKELEALKMQENENLECFCEEWQQVLKSHHVCHSPETLMFHDFAVKNLEFSIIQLLKYRGLETSKSQEFMKWIQAKTVETAEQLLSFI
jgi:hypothetical protein